MSSARDVRNIMFAMMIMMYPVDESVNWKIWVPFHAGVKGNPEKFTTPIIPSGINLLCRSEVRNSKPPANIHAIPHARLASGFASIAAIMEREAIPRIQN
jgi:hypothetical protein